MQMKTSDKKMEWSKELPTEPGFYWFFGWIYGKRETRIQKKPMHTLVELRRVGPDDKPYIVYIANGGFVDYPKEAIGYFVPAPIPDLPQNIDWAKDFNLSLGIA
jgi:hypothetical protein